MFRWLNQEKPEKINSGYGTFLFDLFQKLESNAFDEILYFINLSFGYFVVVRSSWDKNNEKWVQKVPFCWHFPCFTLIILYLLITCIKEVAQFS